MYDASAAETSRTLTPSFALVGPGDLDELRRLESLGAQLDYLLAADAGRKELLRCGHGLAVGLEALRRRLEGEGRP